MRNHSLRIFLILFSTLILYFFIGYLDDFRNTIEIYFGLLLLLYALYGYLISLVLRDSFPKKISFSSFLIIGILFRLILIPSEPVLSDDIYRYLWDGRISAAGINPYAYAPDNVKLSEFRDESVYPQINFPGIATVYPPVSQFFFLVNHWIGGTVFTWKMLLLVIETLFVVLLLKLLHHFSLDKFRLLIFFYNPLLIIETYHSGHLEIIGALFFWLAVYTFYKHYDWRSILFFSLAIMTKFIPLISGIPLLINKFIRKGLLVLGISAVILIPFSLGGTLPLPGLYSYLNRWEFNGAIYQIINSFFKWVNVREFEWMTAMLGGHLEIFYINTAFYYKMIAVIILLVVIFDQINKLKPIAGFRGIRFIQTSYILTGTILLLTPTLYPWYLIWMIPFLIFQPNWSWLSFTFLIQLSYYVLKHYSINGNWEESVWILFLEYVPFYVLLMIEYLDKKRIKGWFL